MIMHDFIEMLEVLLMVYLIQVVLVVVALVCNTEAESMIKTRRQFFICLIPYVWMYAFMQLVYKQFKKLK
jgi:hypothetical protein